jgi:opacity protein-like surface antigen
VAARFGVIAQNTLFYGKAGVAGIHNIRKMDSTLFGDTSSTPDAIRWGWMVGAGVETALSPSLTAKIEYDYADFGTRAHTFTDQFGDVTGVSIRQNAHIVKLGLNQKFDGVPFVSQPKSAMPMTAGSWTGVYVGAHVGGAMGHDKWTSATNFFNTWGFFPEDRFPGEGNSEGLLVGGQIGANYQIGSYVFGVEAAASLTDYNGAAKCAFDSIAVFSWTCRNFTTAMGNISGRLGQSFGNLLLYGKAGAAWAVHDGTIEILGVDKVYTSPKTVHWGLLTGAGAEYAFSPNLSAFIEYNNIYFGNTTTDYTITDATAVIGIHVNQAVSAIGFKQKMDVVKAGVNYRFGAGSPASNAMAADPAMFMPSPLASNWSLEVGERLVGGSTRMQWDLYSAFNADQVNSRITNNGQTLQGFETFFRLDHKSGLFAKGNFGIGRYVDGRMNDEDFEVLNLGNYSNTVLQLKDGRQINGAADLGYSFINDGAARFGAFIGYRSVYNRSNGFGCTQIGFAVVPQACVPAFPANLIGITQTESWRGVAIGLNSKVKLSDRVRLEVDAAYIPYANHAAVDSHWWRADINPLVEPGHGWGTQFEGVLSYDVTDRLSVGIGGRYWYFTTTSAYAQFPNFLSVSPLKFYTQSYAGYLQTSYKFGDLGEAPTSAYARMHTKAPPMAAAVNWTGVYAGISLGAAAGLAKYNDPFPGALPGTDYADIGGALAGGQIGVNYQTGQFVLGAEISGAWADIQGDNTCFSGFPDPVLAGFNCGTRINALAAFTGRAGVAFDRALVYAKGGVAVDHQTDMFNAVGAGNLIGTPTALLNSNSSNWGYTVGAGVEYALVSNWSAALEYMYYDFGKSAAFTTTIPPGLANVNLAPNDTAIHSMSLRLNYRFDPRAFVAR